ncbi:MAG: gamma-glutamyl-gamma-aminobutyrate hydrolase family protein, partial [Candidatus Latescibacteria bacterium]|nr:gamma-glutamyl-gamma-aminobutyrate hydrolase family protein [Candidatus Latescibacterota bacterium]
MNPPIIGITTGFTPEKNQNRAQQSVNHDYVLSVERAGGCPVLLPMTENPKSLTSLYAILDGLIITGGPGIVEGLVGDLPNDLPPVQSIRHKNDLWVFDIAQQKDVPILGICYGMQFINARFGGTLYADVQNQNNTLAHSPKRTGEPVFHEINIVPNTHLADLLNTHTSETNSYHIQAIEKAGQGLRVNAQSPDQVIEGFETEDGRIIGVQFH